MGIVRLLLWGLVGPRVGPLRSGQASNLNKRQNRSIGWGSDDWGGRPGSARKPEKILRVDRDFCGLVWENSTTVGDAALERVD